MLASTEVVAAKANARRLCDGLRRGARRSIASRVATKLRPRDALGRSRISANVITMPTSALQRTCAGLVVIVAGAGVAAPAAPRAAASIRALPACCDGVRVAGHEPDINPALRRFTGIVVDLGAAAADGRHFTLRIGPIGPRSSPPAPDMLKGWRLTVLAGKRFSSVYRVAGNTETEIAVDASGEPVDGIEARDVFVVEEIDPAASAPTSRLAPSGALG